MATLDVKNSIATKPGTQELELTRILDAPRSLVFRAWTDQKHLAEWWGPVHFTNPRCEINLRPGGAIRIDMRAPDGTVYPMGGAYCEIIEPERLVFTTVALDHQGNSMLVNLNTVIFEEYEGDKTLLRLHVRVLEATSEAAQHLKGMEQGWSSSLTKLDALMRPSRA